MKCPDCLREMTRVTLGRETRIELDSCDHCGGTWTDQSEINFVSLSDLTDVGIPPKRLRPVTPPKNRSCPKDGTLLTRFRADSVPEHIGLFHCETCGGNWFPKDTIREFKKAQAAKVSFLKSWHIPLASAYAVLIPFFLVLIITGGMIVTVQSIQKEQLLESRAGPMLSVPTVRNILDGEVFIDFTTLQPQTSHIRYWPAGNIALTRSVPVSTTSKTLHTIRLTGLTAKTTYFYTILVGAENRESNVYSFTTQ